MGGVTSPTSRHPDGPFTLDRRTVLSVAPDPALSALSVDEESWTRAGALPELRDGRIMSIFAYETSWTWWERHPVGTEFVLVLAGAAVFHLCDGAEDRSVELAAGECLLVREMVWHRADVTAPTSMLFLTPSPARTEHRDA